MVLSFFAQASETVSPEKELDLNSFVGTYRGNYTNKIAPGAQPLRFDLTFSAVKNDELVGTAQFHNSQFQVCVGTFPLTAKREGGILVVTVDKKTNSLCDTLAIFRYKVSPDYSEITSRLTHLKRISPRVASPQASGSANEQK